VEYGHVTAKERHSITDCNLTWHLLVVNPKRLATRHLRQLNRPL